MNRHLGQASARVLLVGGLVWAAAVGLSACASTPPEPPPGPMIGDPVSGPSVEPSAPAQSVRVASTPPSPGIVPPGSASPANVYTGPQPCTMAVRGDSPVARACREGGSRSAKITMKKLVEQARVGGERFRCDDCHLNTDNYAQLGTGADEKFRRLLAAAGVK